ncbi:MAG: SDR family oxidoreductase [Candidatus Helarchaeota archaeon]|nr:SDR family oxidoreductase [Candidatus Helarchaeota archaeon]
MKLKNKIVLLTGAASGIGRSTAIFFAKEGAIQILADINQEGGEETVKLIKKEAPDAKAEFINLDVSKSGDVAETIEKILKKYGRIDVLINNAGVVRVGLPEEFTEEDYDLLINVNLKGTFFCCKYAIPYFKKQKSGVIVNLASVAGHIGQVNHANYCSTKAGVLGMTRALALDLAPFNVRVNSVSPGATDTPMLRSDVAKNARERGVDFEVVKKEFEEEGLFGRWAKPIEVAKAILFLASDDSSYMTGADILVDGGWVAR